MTESSLRRRRITAWRGGAEGGRSEKLAVSERRQLGSWQTSRIRGEAMSPADLHAFMSQHRYGVVSSVSASGDPQSALVGIAVSAELDIVFDTLGTSRKYSNLTRNPRCSMVVGWSGEQTLQYEGLAEQPAGAALERYQELYFTRWPECRTHLSWPDIAYFVLRPRWIRYSDYDHAPPLIEEMEHFR